MRVPRACVNIRRMVKKRTCRIKTSVYFDPEDLKKLKRLAEKRDTTIARLLRKAIKKLLSEK